MLVRVPANHQVLLHNEHYHLHGCSADRTKQNQTQNQQSKRRKQFKKKMDDLRAELELGKSNVGDTIQVAQNPVSIPARKLYLGSLENCFDLALNLDVCVIYLIQFCRRGRKQRQLRRWPQF